MIRALLWVAKRLPDIAALVIARLFGAIAFGVMRSDRRRAIRQLREAMPEIRSPAATVFHLFVHFGTIVAGWLNIDLFTRPDSKRIEFSAESQAALRDAYAAGRGVLAVVPHIGNWELLAQLVARRGYKTSAVAKRSYDPRVTTMISSFRESAGVHCLWRGDASVQERMRGVLARGPYGHRFLRTWRRSSAC